jgi:hypothetical protein
MRVQSRHEKHFEGLGSPWDEWPCHCSVVARRMSSVPPDRSAVPGQRAGQACTAAGAWGQGAKPYVPMDKARGVAGYPSST